MRYIVELPSVKVQAIRALIDSGKYEDIQSFILAAIENQLYLERQPIERITSVDSYSKKAPEEKLHSSSLVSLMHRPALELSDIVTVQEPQREALGAEILWALHNRILPIKISLRVILNSLRLNPTNDGYMDLITIQDAATEEARRVGRLLLQADKRYRRIHGEKLSAGFPIATGDRAKDRFKFHFVGSVNSKNHLEGAPAILRFVNIIKDQQGHPRIGITKPGFQFAIIENPVLDKADYTRPLGEEESNFYVKHLSEKLPKEYLVSINILKAIANGHNTPDELTEVILSAKLSVKKKEAQAIRSSLISRLSELGLVTRKRTGLNVTYALTTSGSDFIKNKETIHEEVG